MARSAVLIVRRRGGRFLRRNVVDGGLYELGDAKATEKALRALTTGVKPQYCAPPPNLGGQREAASVATIDRVSNAAVADDDCAEYKESSLSSETLRATVKLSRTHAIPTAGPSTLTVKATTKTVAPFAVDISNSTTNNVTRCPLSTITRLKELPAGTIPKIRFPTSREPQVPVKRVRLKDKPKGKRCKYEGCVSLSRRGGVCRMHGASGIVCTHEGCQSNAVKEGVCRRHGAEAILCRHCTNVAKKGGVCYNHGAKRKVCTLCTNMANIGNLCSKHAAKKTHCPTNTHS